MQIVLLSLVSSGTCSGERVPVLACRDALRAAGAEVTTVSAESDEQIDAALTECFGPAGGDPAASSDPAPSGEHAAGGDLV
ncbi:MAG: hypothetical protein ACRDT4_16875, partial [Micromonosporaceae bacterium]